MDCRSSPYAGKPGRGSGILVRHDLAMLWTGTDEPPASRWTRSGKGINGRVKYWKGAVVTWGTAQLDVFVSKQDITKMESCVCGQGALFLSTLVVFVWQVLYSSCEEFWAGYKTELDQDWCDLQKPAKASAARINMELFRLSVWNKVVRNNHVNDSVTFSSSRCSNTVTDSKMWGVALYMTWQTYK